MLARIEAIETAGPASKARRLIFSEGIEPRLTSATVVKQLGLEADSHVEIESLEADLQSAERVQARERALRMLGYRDRSQVELQRALTAEGYPDTIARAVVDRLVEVDLVDDARLAAAWVRSRAAAGLGSRRILRELSEKGIADDVAAAAFEAEYHDDPVAAARGVLRGRTPETRAERDRMLRKLVSRGFDLRVAYAALEQPDTDGDMSSDA